MVYCKSFFKLLFRGIATVKRTLSKELYRVVSKLCHVTGEKSLPFFDATFSISESRMSVVIIVHMNFILFTTARWSGSMPR